MGSGTIVCPQTMLILALWWTISVLDFFLPEMITIRGVIWNKRTYFVKIITHISNGYLAANISPILKFIQISSRENPGRWTRVSDSCNARIVPDWTQSSLCVGLHGVYFVILNYFVIEFIMILCISNMPSSSRSIQFDFKSSVEEVKCHPCTSVPFERITFWQIKSTFWLFTSIFPSPVASCACSGKV